MLGPNFSVAGLSQGLGGLIGGGISSAFGAAIGNPFASAATPAFSAASSATRSRPPPTGSSAARSAASARFSAGFGGAAPLAWIEKGGIMPSAAGGWVVPSFAEGGVLSMLHRNEMVLPSHISQFVQDAASRGGAGGGHTFNMNISAWDSRDVMRAGPQLVASLNRAMRNGSLLNQRT